MGTTALGLFILISVTVGQDYCSSGPILTADTNLGPVTLVGDTTSIQDGFDCPKSVGPRDLTNLVADVSPGKTYTLTFQITACGSVYPYLVGAWIDYNKNGAFETNENLFFWKGNAVNTTSQSFTIPTPLDARGITRLRLQVAETTSTTIDPCDEFYYGATKDYSINLSSKNLYCNCGPTSDQDTTLGPAIFLGEKIDIIQYANPCPGTFGPRNFTDQLADLVRGKTYSFAFSVVTCNKPYPKTLSSAWIDWNRNEVFDDSERILPPNARFGGLFVQVTVPSNAVPGPTTVRTMVQEMVNGGTTIGPCDMFQFGGTYDYPISVQ